MFVILSWDCVDTPDSSGDKLIGPPTQDSSSHWKDIPWGNIIGVQPSPGSNGESRTVLYVDDNTAAQDDATKSPVVFRSIVASKLPHDCLQDVQHLGESDWRARYAAGAESPNLHVLVSTGSGTGLARSVWELSLKPLLSWLGLKQGEDYAPHFTSSETTVAELTQEIFLPRANMGTAQVITLLSGDGGMVDLVNAVLSGQRSQQYLKPVVTLLPLGTGNALAHSTGITGDNTMGLRTWLQGSPKELPLFRATFSPGARSLIDEGQKDCLLQEVDGKPTLHGAVVASWGLHAGLVADSDTTEFRKFGAERFKMAAKEALYPSDGSPSHAYKGRVSVLKRGADGEEHWEDIDRPDHGYVLATLVSHLEKGFTISPGSTALDGKLRLVHFGAMSGQKAMEIMMQAYDGGKHIGNDRVGYEEMEGFRIDFQEEEARWRRVCIDGKIVRVEKGGWMEVRGGVSGVVDLVVM